MSKKPGTGSIAAGDKATADSSNNPKQRPKIKTFFDYCKEDTDQKVIEVNKLPYLQGLDTQMRKSLNKRPETLTPERDSPSKGFSKKKSKIVQNSPYL